MQVGPENVKAEMPATYCVGSDRYSGRIAKVSPSGKTVTFVGDGGTVRVARWSSPRGYHPAYRSHGQTIVGVARDYRDPSF